MDMSVSMRTEGGTPVLALSGTADEGLLLRLAGGVGALTDDASDLVVDVHDLLLSDANALRAFLAELLGGSVKGRLAFVCGRVSGRQVLKRLGGDAVHIFATVKEAVEGLGPAPAYG